MPDVTNSPVLLEPCDIFLTKGTSPVARAIRFFSARLGEKRAKVNHVGIIVDGGTLHSAVAVEALSKVQMHALRRYSKKRTTGVAVYRPINLTEDEKREILNKARSYVDRPYGYGKIVAHLLDWGLQGAYVFRRLTNEDSYPICSWVVAHAYNAASKDFGVEPGEANPDHIWNFVTTETDKYIEVRGLVPIPVEVKEVVPA